jgi:hypothetical protein
LGLLVKLFRQRKHGKFALPHLVFSFSGSYGLPTSSPHCFNSSRLPPWMAHWIAIRREQAHLRGYIPSMTDKEREIIGYLLAKNQKLFIAAQDGGYAMPLISQRIVKIALQPGQTYSFEHTPMVIPDHLWEVLVAHRDRFPYSSLGGNHEPDPWRIPWMMRR